MSNLTDFGVAVRKLRLDYGWTLKELAAELGVSSAYLSNVETGKKPIPSDLALRIAEAMNLNQDEFREIKREAINSLPRVVIDLDGLDGLKMEAARLLALKLPTMSYEDVRTLRMVLEKAR